MKLISLLASLLVAATLVIAAPSSAPALDCTAQPGHTIHGGGGMAWGGCANDGMVYKVDLIVCIETGTPVSPIDDPHTVWASMGCSYVKHPYLGYSGVNSVGFICVTGQLYKERVDTYVVAHDRSGIVVGTAFAYGPTSLGVRTTCGS